MRQRPDNKSIRIISLFFIVVVSFSIFVLLQSGFKSLLPTSEDVNIISLAGSYQSCLPEDASLKNARSSCGGYYNEKLPALKPSFGNIAERDFKKVYKGYIYYKKSFVPPKHCISQTCSVFLKEVGDTARVYINGRFIGEHGSFPPNYQYKKNHALSMQIPTNFLTKNNIIEIISYSPQSSQIGVRHGPLLLGDKVKLESLLFRAEAINVVIPLAGAIFIFLTLFLLLWIYVRSNDVKEQNKLKYFILFSIACGFFLFSFSEIPREHIDLTYASFIHFLSRLIFDLLSFTLVLSFFEIKNKILIHTKKIYVLSIILFCSAFFLERAIELRFFGLSSFDSVIMYIKGCFPLLLLPPLLAFCVCLKEYLGSKFGKKLEMPYDPQVFMSLFLVITFFQIHDILVFHRLLDAEYYVKWYPILMFLFFLFYFIGSYFSTKAKLREKAVMGEFLKNKANMLIDVAHNLKSPVSQLTAFHAAGDSARFRQSCAKVLECSNKIMSFSKEMIDFNPDTAHIETNLIEHADIDIDDQIFKTIDETLKNKEKELFGAVNIVNALSRRHFEGKQFKYDSHELEAILSNIINNATEAMACMPMQDAYVEVSSRLNSQTVEIIIKDNGPGFHKQFLGPEGIKRGKTIKKEGHGIGLSSAKHFLKSWGADLEVSNNASGASVQILLPIITEVDSTELFVINLKKYKSIVLLDDDKLMHDLWNLKIKGACSDCKIYNFFNPESFEEWLSVNSQEKFFLISDYNLGANYSTGLEVINNIQHQDSLLVSGHDLKHIKKESNLRLPNWLKYVNKHFLHTRISFQV